MRYITPPWRELPSDRYRENYDRIFGKKPEAASADDDVPTDDHAAHRLVDVEERRRLEREACEEID